MLCFRWCDRHRWAKKQPNLWIISAEEKLSAQPGNTRDETVSTPLPSAAVLSLASSVSITPPETEHGASSCRSDIARSDAAAERDAVSSYRPCVRPGDSIERQERTDFLSQSNRAQSILDYQAQLSESCYVSAHGSHAHSKESMTMRADYDRQQPYSSLSSCSWDNSSSSLEAVPITPNASRHVVGNMRPKSKIFGHRPDYFASYPTNGLRMRRSSYPAAAKADFGLDYHSEHQYGRSDRLTALSNCNCQSFEHHNEIDDLPRRTRFVEEAVSFSNRWSFDNGASSPLRGLQYGDEIPSLSTRKCNGNEVLSCSSQWPYGSEIPSISSRQGYGDEIPSLSTQKCNGFSHSSHCHHGAETPLLSSGQGYGGEIPSLSTERYNGISRSTQWHYGAEIPSLSSRPSSARQGFGDEIPSLSRHWHNRDKIPMHSGQRCHDAVAHRLPSYQQGAFRGSGHLRYGSVRTIVGNQQVKMNSGNQTVRRPRVANRAINSTDRCRVSKKDNPWRNSEDIRDQVRGPRANKLNDTATPTTEKDIMSPLVRRDQLNRSDFSVQYEHAKFFMIKSYSEDDIHKGIKYNVWASTPNGNNKLDSAFQEAQVLLKEKGTKCPVFLFFSVNTSGQFVGLAEMLGPVDFKKTMDFWQQDKWNGFFPVVWHIIKDIPNRLFKHITLENNDNRPVTFSRDTQEIGLPQGLEAMKIFKGYRHGSSILDDFDFYEEKENKRCA